VSFPIEIKRTTVVTYVTLVFTEDAEAIELPAHHAGYPGMFQPEQIEITFNGDSLDYTLGIRRLLVKGGLSDQLMNLRRFALPADVVAKMDALAREEGPQ
jgi:hypothetical protein